MRSFTATSFSVLMVLLMITPIIIVHACEIDDEKEDNVSLLLQLHDAVLALPDDAFENVKLGRMKRKTLGNKVNAVMNQINAGSYEGALNKLKNDVEKVVSKCITCPWKDYLVDLIEDLIEFIRNHNRFHPIDPTPPTIHNVLQYPDMPEYDDHALVLAHISDVDDNKHAHSICRRCCCHHRRHHCCRPWYFQSGVADATLSYSVDSGESINLTMQEIDGLYKAEIPPQPYNVTVTFMIYALDNAGNAAVSSVYSYVVGDSHPPVISYVEHLPASPSYNETVSVFVNATEPSSASGVRGVILTYDNGTACMNVTMSLQDGLYVAVIPQLPYRTVVQYRVYAFDNAGNWAAMDIYSYAVEDRFMPVAKIEAPASRSYLAGYVDIEVYVYDDNFVGAELTVNETALASWSQAGLNTHVWNTTEVPDGFYVLQLDAYDAAGNIAETECPVIVDNTMPTAKIDQPKDGSYVRGTVLVEVHADDFNLDQMELVIEDSARVWKVEGSQTYIWQTLDYDDGLYTVVLAARDKAGNQIETNVLVILDNTAPSFSNLVWIPSEPVAGEEVNVSLQVFEDGSGIRNVTLWFIANTSDWKSVNMNLQNGNWTCKIPYQEAGVNVVFYVECFDNAGNSAQTVMEAYTAKEKEDHVSGFPLGWLLLIIVVIAAAAGLSFYFFKRRKKTA